MSYHDYEDIDTLHLVNLRSISEMEDLEKQDYEDRHRGITGLLFALLFSAPFWLFGAYIYILRYYR